MTVFADGVNLGTSIRFDEEFTYYWSKQGMVA